MRGQLFYYELKKILKTKYFWFILLVFTLLNFFKIFKIYSKDYGLVNLLGKAKLSVYHALNEEFEGELTDSKINHFMLDYYIPSEEKIANLTQSTREDMPDSFTGNYMRDNILINQYYKHQMEYNYSYEYKCLIIEKNAKFNISFFRKLGRQTEARKNERLFHSFSGRKLKHFYQVEDFEWLFTYSFSVALSLFLILYTTVGKFSDDVSIGINNLLVTTVSGGSKSVLAKIQAAAFFSVLVILYFSILDLITFSIFFPSLKAWNMPLYMLRSCDLTPLNITFSQAYLLEFVFKCIGAMIVSTSILLIGIRSRTTLYSFFLSTVLFGGLVIRQEATIGSVFWLQKLFNPMTYLLCNIQIFATNDFLQLWGCPLYIYEAAFAFSLGELVLVTLLVYLAGKRNHLDRLHVKSLNSHRQNEYPLQF